MPLPFTPATGFGMNVAYTPNSCAASFTVSRYVITLSAMDSASVYRRSISCWDGATSWWTYCTGMPMASRYSTVRFR